MNEYLALTYAGIAYAAIAGAHFGVVLRHNQGDDSPGFTVTAAALSGLCWPVWFVVAITTGYAWHMGSSWTERETHREQMLRKQLKEKCDENERLHAAERERLAKKP